MSAICLLGVRIPFFVIGGVRIPCQQASILDAPPDEADEVSSAFRPKKRRARRHRWIFQGWTYVERTRKSGRRAGTKYREYFDPSGKMYRSKRDAEKAAERNN